MASLSTSAIEQNKNLPFNFIVNVLDGGFFGLGLGFASFSTVIPLFVSTLTDSAILIGLIPAIHVVGWQLPQLFTAQRVSQQKRNKPRGLFFGFQSGAANLLASGGAIIAGLVLVKNIPTIGFTMCFLFACIAFAISYLAMSFTREESKVPITTTLERKVFWKDTRAILKRDTNFRWFVVGRILAQLGTVGFAFYTVYVVRYYGVDEVTAGILTGLLMIIQTLFNPIMGWLGDRWSHRGVMAVGMISAAVSAGVALWAPSVGWFYLAYALAGIANVAVWTIARAFSLEFGREHEKPAYIGLANTLIAPTAFIIHLFAGWLADYAGYHATFLATSIGAIATVLVLSFFMQDHSKHT